MYNVLIEFKARITIAVRDIGYVRIGVFRFITPSFTSTPPINFIDSTLEIFHIDCIFSAHLGNEIYLQRMMLCIENKFLCTSYIIAILSVKHAQLHSFSIITLERCQGLVLTFLVAIDYSRALPIIKLLCSMILQNRLIFSLRIVDSDPISQTRPP